MGCRSSKCGLEPEGYHDMGIQDGKGKLPIHVNARRKIPPRIPENLTSNSRDTGMKLPTSFNGRGKGRGLQTTYPESADNREPMSKPMPIRGFALARLPKERAKTVFCTLEALEESGMLSFRYAKKNGISYEEWIAGQHLFLSSVSGRKDEMREYLFGN